MTAEEMAECVAAKGSYGIAVAEASMHAGQLEAKAAAASETAQALGSAEAKRYAAVAQAADAERQFQAATPYNVDELAARKRTADGERDSAQDAFASATHANGEAQADKIVAKARLEEAQGREQEMAARVAAVCR